MNASTLVSPPLPSFVEQSTPTQQIDTTTTTPTTDCTTNDYNNGVVVQEVIVELEEDGFDEEEEDDNHSISTTDIFLSELKEEVVLRTLLHKRLFEKKERVFELEHNNGRRLLVVLPPDTMSVESFS